MKRLFICGSVRPHGKSAHLADALADRALALDEGTEVAVFSLADDVEVEPCLACDYCALGEGCIIEDDMQELYELLDAADALAIVSPLYFAGPPAQLKAVLDRLQRYFRSTYTRGAPKRPAELFAIGDGGDPHGHEPLAAIVRSALAVAGFRLEAVHACIGKDPDELAAIAQAWEPARGISR